MSLFNKKSKKDSSYISARDSRRITRFNRKLTQRLEKQREMAADNPSMYETTMQNPDNVVEFDNMCTYFFTDIGTVKAVDGVSFEVPKKSTVGIVGESGCGKSVTSLSLMQLVQRPQGQTVGGEIRFNVGDGKAYNIVNTPTVMMQHIRGNKVSMIFQEPMTSLNPVFRIGRQLDEVMELHGEILFGEDGGKDLDDKVRKQMIKEHSIEMLKTVGIANSEGVYDMFPHELSGGMRQRVMIAMALSCNPNLNIADEPTTALDVTIQAQILDLLKNLKDKIGSSIMLITHDLGVVADMADYVVVMYAGRIVEKGTAEDIFHNPCHPYTIGLMKSKPVVGKKVDELYNIPGSVPNPVNMPNYCYFRDRCEYCTGCCDGDYPPEIKISDTHFVSCYRYLEQGEVVRYPKSVNVEEL
ncbi:MAG: ABC transporter ATP-binding protein [Clostridia bacterium]|nr:ABC transporter ATP-binding protein [Clostridia bacterium]